MVVDFDRLITGFRKKFLKNSLKSPTVRRISRRFFRGPSPRLYVVIPYWHAVVSSLMMRDLEKRILKAGHSCLAYQFPVKVLSENIRRTTGYFKELQKRAERDIKVFRKKHNFSEVVLIGMSLGGVGALMVASNNPDIQKLILVVPGDSLADSLWTGIGTIELKEKIVKRGIALEDLEREWKELEPKDKLGGLTDKEIEIHLSKSDEVIPYKNGRGLIKAMKKTGLKPKVFENKDLGHYLTVFEFILKEKF